MATDPLLAALETLPSRLKTILDGVPDEALRRGLDAEGWSALEIVAHLRAADAILAPRIMQILVRPGSRYPALDERRWAEVAQSRQMPLETQLLLYGASRVQLIVALSQADPAAWLLTGEHEELGPQSVRSIATHLAKHEAEHVEQLYRLIPKVWPAIVHVVEGDA